MLVKPGNWCYRCGAYEHEPAGPTCTNPGWHIGKPVEAKAEARPKSMDEEQGD